MIRPKNRSRRRPAAVLFIGLMLLASSGVASALNGVITIDQGTGHISDQSGSLTPDHLKPSDCASLTLDQLVGPGSSVSEPDNGALILADSSTTSLTGGTGNDCIVGGANTTSINGGAGNDVCIGNANTVFTNCETQIPPPATTHTIFDNATPGTVDPNSGDSNVELGVRFTADVNGTITGIRFYKASANTGTHHGELWDNSGTLLKTGTFSGETSSGWQTLTFDTPVSVTAGTTYMASYYCPNGHYSVDQWYFTNTAHDNAPLHALASGNGVTNGTFKYYTWTGTPEVPDGSFKDTNYYVDVMFVAS